MSLCEGCHAGCCRSFAVPVTGADILRIERDLGLDFWSFVCRWADPDGNIAHRYAPQFRFEDEPEMPFVVCLQHAESRYFPQTTMCQFLAEQAPDEEHPLGTAHCGIYGSRPAACRVFPAKFNDTEDLAILHDVPSHGRGGQDEVYSLCPRPWTPQDVDPLEVLPNLAVAKYEMQFFHYLAAAWNRAPKAWSLFPDFLRVVYANRVAVQTSREAADDGEVARLAAESAMSVVTASAPERQAA